MAKDFISDDETGNVGDFISDEQAAAIPGFNPSTTSQPMAGNSALNQTHQVPNPSDFVSDDQAAALDAHDAKYGSGMQQLATGAEGAAQGLLGPLATLAETKLMGIDPQDILARQETNPGTHLVGEMAGFVAPALMTGGASGLAKLTQVGALEAVTKKLGLEAAGNTLAAKIGAGAAKAAVENALVQGGDEVSKMILEDPHQTVQTAITNIGLSGAIGGLLGGGIGGASHLWSAKSERKSGEFIQDFASRIKEHTENPDPVKSMHNELTEYYKGIQGIADDVYGPSGLKSQDIRKALPELNTTMLESTSAVGAKLSHTIDKMAADPYTYPPRLTKMLQADFDNFASKISKDDISAASAFEATQDLKQTMQGYAKFEKRVEPFKEEHGFVKVAKKLQSDLRETLEDTRIWGDAAKRQQSINKAFTEYLPSLKDFEKKFTTMIGEDRVIDETKIATYVKQLDKNSSAVKKEMLGNFLDASDKYKGVLDQSHANLGIDSPVLDSSLNVTRRSLGERTTGEKAADWVIHKGLAKGAGAGLGAGLGMGVAGMMGLPHSIGALLGAHVAGPFLESILPGIAKALVEGSGTAKGLKATAEAGMATVKGESLINKTVTNLFKAGREILPGSNSHSSDIIPSYAQVSDRKRDELKRAVAAINADPTKLLNNVNGHLGQFTPGINQALGQTTANALTYLATQRPNTDKGSPLDAKPVAPSTSKASYDQALDLAQQPLLILNKLHKGTLTSADLKHVNALYPGFVLNLQKKLMAETTKIISKHGPGAIPYKTRLGLSLIFNQPLDSTIKSQSIQSTQIVPGYAKSQPTPAPGVKSSPALQKSASKYLTPQQARMQHSQQK